MTQRRTIPQLLILVILLCFTNNSFSQKPVKLSPRKLRQHKARVLESKRNGTVIWSLDTIFKKGIPYAIFIRQKNLPYHIYTLFSLDRMNLANIYTEVSNKNGEVFYYSFRFTASEKTAEPEKYKFDLVQKIVEFDLVQNKKIDPLSEIKFLNAFPRRFSDPNYVETIGEKPATTKDMYATAERDRDKEFHLDGPDIYQDYTLIGRYKSQGDLLRFYLPTGIMVAQATRSEEEQTWHIESLKDKKTLSITPQADNGLREIISLLIKKGYL